MSDERPIWLLDVDGVLNAVCPPIPEGYEKTRSDGYGITFRRSLIDRVILLHRSEEVEVRWLTTWCNRARDILAPDLGMPEFVVEGEDLMLQVPEPNGWWKSTAAQRVSEAEPTRPLIWTDDDLEDAEQRGEVDWLKHRTAPTLAISPNWRTGITDEFMDRIEAFAERHSAASLLVPLKPKEPR